MSFTRAPRATAAAASEPLDGSGAGTSGIAKPGHAGGIRRAMSFGRKPKGAAAAAGGQPAAAAVAEPPGTGVSAPGSERRAKEVQDLMHGVGGGRAADWLQRAEEAIELQNPAGKQPDARLVLSERIFVRVGKWPYYRSKQVSRDGDQISIADLCEGTILDSRATNALNYELRMVVQSGGVNMMIDVRCIKKAHYANLSSVSAL